MANLAGTTLQQLRPYEPDREQSELPDTGGPLALDLSRAPNPVASEPDDPPIELRQLRAVLSLLLEVRTGHRPAGRVRALVSPRLYRLLNEETQVSTARYTLKTVHGCRVAPHAVEACGTAHSQGRAYAVVARFERSPQGWYCTFFDLIRPRATPRDRRGPGA